MGYESKLYIVEKSNLKDNVGKVYTRVIAMFDMCKFHLLSGVLCKEPKTNCYFYADDGDTKVLEDRYGDALTETTVETVIGILEEAIENGENYRRIFPLLSMLKTIDKQQKDDVWREIVVLHYGY